MDSNIGKKLDGRYELIELIGVGGMADIYKAKDITEDRTVAVKILKNEFAGSEDFLRRFRNESKAIALLSHPNIVKIFDVGFTDRIQFIVMEYIDGITLTEYIERQGVLKWRDAIHFTVQILKALQHAHDRGIVHRDIKSQNVMLMPDGTIKVMDFGIARFNRETDKTLSEKAIGSVHYISPEQARGDITDEKSDIYSVGVMLYEMLTGQKPFDGDNPVSIALMHMQTVPKKPRSINSSIPEGLEEITLKAMQKKPADRYQTAGEMIKDIEEFKKNPAIIFEYKYFSTDGKTKYFDKVQESGNMENKKKRIRVDESRYDDADDDFDDDGEYEDEEDDDEVTERRSPLLSILFAVASVFVIVSAWLVFELVTQNLGDAGETIEEIKMPYLIGMTWDQACEEYGSVLSLEAEQAYSSDHEKYQIIDQSVPANKTIKATQKVTVTVSKGPHLVEIDNFENRSRDEVEALIKKQDLQPKIIYAESEDVPAEYVIKTEPAAREMVEIGTVVKVYVSQGPSKTLTAVPQMIGLSLASAQARADEYNILLTVLYEPSNVEEGRVIDQSIDALEKVEKNTLVEIKVSNGETPVKESKISLLIHDHVTGVFELTYYIDGVLQENMTETRDMALSKNIVWNISGSEIHEFAINVTSKDTGKTGLLVKAKVDFTKDPPEKEYPVMNGNIFTQLLSNNGGAVYEPSDTQVTEQTQAPQTVSDGTEAPESQQTDSPETEVSNNPESSVTQSTSTESEITVNDNNLNDNLLDDEEEENRN